jgi:Skp family chaperone for outer membrane proteins
MKRGTPDFLAAARAAAAVLLWLIILAPGAVLAQALEPASRIGIVDVQRILGESVAMSALSKELEAIRIEHQAALREGEKVIREADRSLALERPNLKASVYARKRRELEMEATTLQRNYQEKMRAADATFRQGMAQIQQQLTLVTQEIAAERKLDIVLAKATIVLVRPELELTDAALALLNQRLPRVQLPELERQ